MRLNLFASAVFIKEVGPHGLQYIVQAEVPITSYENPVALLLREFPEAAYTLFKREDNGPKSSFIYMINGANLQHTALKGLQWKKKSFFSNASGKPLNSLANDVNEKAIDEIFDYLKRLQSQSCLGYLWD